MKAYSNGLRTWVAAACAEPGARLVAVAARFYVSVSFVEKLRQRQRTTDSVAALPHRSGPAPLPNAAVRGEGLPAPGARCHARRVAHLAGGPWRAGREPGHAGAGRAGT